MQIFDTLDGIMWKYLCVTTSCEEGLIIGGSAQSNLEFKLCANFKMIQKMFKSGKEGTNQFK